MGDYIDLMVNELFSMLLLRFIRLDIPSSNVKKEMRKDIYANIEWAWEWHEKNNNDSLLDIYGAWLRLDDKLDSYLNDMQGYELICNFRKATHTHYFPN
jgi:hypothetical protein